MESSLANYFQAIASFPSKSLSQEEFGDVQSSFQQVCLAQPWNNVEAHSNLHLQVLQGYKNMIPNFDSFLSQLPPNVAQKLRQVYQVWKLIFDSIANSLPLSSLDVLLRLSTSFMGSSSTSGCSALAHPETTLPVFITQLLFPLHPHPKSCFSHGLEKGGTRTETSNLGQYQCEKWDPQALRFPFFSSSLHILPIFTRREGRKTNHEERRDVMWLFTYVILADCNGHGFLMRFRFWPFDFFSCISMLMPIKDLFLFW